MALITFIIPTDKDILKDLNVEPQAIKFIGSGRFSQTLNEIKFSRIFRHYLDKENSLREVIYHRKGLLWEFKTVISIQVNNKQTVIEQQ